MVFDDQLSAAVIVGGIRSFIFPFEPLVPPVLVTKLEIFLKNVAEAPLCESVLANQTDPSCLVFRHFRAMFCTSCQRKNDGATTAVKRSAENSIAVQKKFCTYRNMKEDQLREHCRAVSQESTASKKQNSRMQGRVERQADDLLSQKKEMELLHSKLASAPKEWTEGGWLNTLPEPLRGFLKEFEQLFNCKDKRGRRYKRKYMEQCTELYWYVGGRGYRALLKTMQFPLPSVRTLRRELAQSTSSCVGLSEVYLDKMAGKLCYYYTEKFVEN